MARSCTIPTLVPAPSSQPGESAKYGDVFAAMLRSSPHLQVALQRVATVAQIRWGAAQPAGTREARRQGGPCGPGSCLTWQLGQHHALP